MSDRFTPYFEIYKETKIGSIKCGRVENPDAAVNLPEGVYEVVKVTRDTVASVTVLGEKK